MKWPFVSAKKYVEKVEQIKQLKGQLHGSCKKLLILTSEMSALQEELNKSNVAAEQLAAQVNLWRHKWEKVSQELRHRDAEIERLQQ